MTDPVARFVRGLWPEPVHGTVNGKQQSFFAPLGCGVGGSSVFYVSNNRTGRMTMVDSVSIRNSATRFGTAGLPGFFVLAAPGEPVVTRTTITY